MSTWQLIFLQSRANNCAYDEDDLPAQNWAWPQGTWFQKRRHYLRETQRKYARQNRPSPPSNRFREVAFVDQGGECPMSFSMVPLPLAEREIPAQAREALLENRRRGAPHARIWTEL